MAKTEAATLAGVKRALEKRTDLASFLAKVRLKDRTNIERHLTACDAEGDPRHGTLWRRLVCALGTMAPLATQTIGEHAMQFFVADGKYRMQVFALEDARDGVIYVYAPDVLADAARLGILGASVGEADGPREVAVGKKKGVTVRLELMDANNTPNPAAHVKNMLGWNRKALRLMLATTAPDAEVEAVESLCAVASLNWVALAPPTAAG